MRDTTLILQSGAQVATREQVLAIPTPEATDSWQPIPHATLVERTLAELTGFGLKLVEEQHGLYRDGLRYFGMFKLAAAATPDFEHPVIEGTNIVPKDWALAIGLRNSHDKSFPASLLGGSWVFVCDNLAFDGEIKLNRRHTRFIMRDIPNLVSRAVAKLVEKREQTARRIECYKNSEVSDMQAHDLIVRSFDARAISGQQLPDVLQQWRAPRHAEFAPRNAWSLFNCFTEVLKASSPTVFPSRTMALSGVFDRYAGLLVPAAEPEPVEAEVIEG